MEHCHEEGKLVNRLFLGLNRLFMVTFVVWNTATWKVNWFILYVIMVNIVVTRRDEGREHNPLCSVRRVCVCVWCTLITHYSLSLFTLLPFHPFNPLTL